MSFVCLSAHLSDAEFRMCVSRSQSNKTGREQGIGIRAFGFYVLKSQWGLSLRSHCILFVCGFFSLSAGLR